MKRNRRLALVLGVGLALTGCDDDFLTTLPPDQLSDEVFWQEGRDAVLAVNAIYPLMYGWETLYLDAASDNTWAQKSFSGWFSIGDGTVDASSGTTDDFWYDSYRAIRRVNEVLANIDRIPSMNEQLRERLKGEARFHRAYHYNMLANLFGDVPLILEPISIEEGKPSRTPRSQVVDQVLADLDFAASVLPESYPASDEGRVTKGAALALKARAALWDSRFREAADAAKAVIDLGIYSLHPNYGELFRYEGENSAEIILADERLQNLRPHGAFGTFGPRSLQGGSDVVPLRSLVDAYHMTDGLPLSESPLYDAENPYANRDPRLYATVLYPGAELIEGQVFNPLPGSGTADELFKGDFNRTLNGYQQIKYVDPADAEDRGNSGIDLILIRYADVLLMYAEAKIELNEIDGSVVEAINQVRRRVGMPEVAQGSQAEMREIVRHERRVELAAEGLRLFDIRRWGIAEEVMPGDIYGIDYIGEDGQKHTVRGSPRRFNPARDYLWPIPEKELDLNPNLEQNPGY